MKRLSFYIALTIMMVGTILPNDRSYGNQTSKEIILAPPIMSNFINIWTDAVDNTQPAVVYNPHHDEYLVVWVTKVDDITWEIWGRRVGSDGSLPTGGWFNIDSVAGLKLTQPAIAYNLLADQYLVVYTSQESSTDFNIWGRVIDWNGVRHSRLYLDTAPLIQSDPAVIYDKKGSQFLLAYESRPAIGQYLIELRTLSASGSVINARTIVSPSDEARFTPAVAYNPELNNFFVVYGLEGISIKPSIIGRTLSTDLSHIGPEFEYTDSITKGVDPSVALGRDDYLIAWYFPDESITVRRADWEGFPLGPAGGFSLSISESMVLNSYPQVTRAGSSRYLVTWNHFQTDTADEVDVYGRYVGFGDNYPMGDSFAIDARDNYQGGVSQACKPSGSCLIVNIHNPVDYPSGDYDISGRLILVNQLYLPLAMR